MFVFLADMYVACSCDVCERQDSGLCSTYYFIALRGRLRLPVQRQADAILGLRYSRQVDWVAACALKGPRVL